MQWVGNCRVQQAPQHLVLPPQSLVLPELSPEVQVIATCLQSLSCGWGCSGLIVGSCSAMDVGGLLSIGCCGLQWISCWMLQSISCGKLQWIGYGGLQLIGRVGLLLNGSWGLQRIGHAVLQSIDGAVDWSCGAAVDWLWGAAGMHITTEPLGGRPARLHDDLPHRGELPATWQHIQPCNMISYHAEMHSLHYDELPRRGAPPAIWLVSSVLPFNLGCRPPTEQR